MESAGKTAVERVPLSWFVFLQHAGPWHALVWGGKRDTHPSRWPVPESCRMEAADQARTTKTI